MKETQDQIFGVKSISDEPSINESQAKVLRFLVKISRQPSRRARAHAAIIRTWNRDPDFELVYPIIEFHWMRAIGYFEQDQKFNPARDQDRIVEYVLDELAKLFPCSF